MVSKKDMQLDIDLLNESLKLTRKQHAETQRALEASERDNAAHRERERARMRRDHAEQQRKRQEAEREDKRKRRRELADGMLRLADVSEWVIVADERGQVLELTVTLPADVAPIVHGVLTKPARSASFIPGDVIANPAAPTLDEIRRAMGFSAGDVTHI
ncbi:hypothetical protein [Microbacterium sp.]|uniref:hypothetical protein n=1 Tax=Microbacterium sp. TaxID=51671 RepID=UPI003A922765